ncbi:MAG: PD-(D/E)XK nuclease family protein, partial [Clostridia bacterium]|nr:PD-(D/E)XK nuclease family protein [Clostridia bacterium]
LEEYRSRGCTALSDEDLSALIDRLLEEYLKSVLGGKDDKSERYKYLYFRYKDNVERLIAHITEELAQSEFQPVDFELAIGGSTPDIDAYTVTDSNGNTVSLRGYVDRIDMMKKNGKQFIRVVDYKTGKKQFHISDILYGLNMQMLLYLSAIQKNGEKRYGEKIVPAGILYMPAEVSAVEADIKDSDDKVKTERDKKLKMNGIILDNRCVVEGMEKNIAGKYIPIKTVKSGEYDKNSDSSLISDDQLKMLFDKADSKLAEMSEALSSGDICAVPVTGSYEPCKWCIFNDACGHEENDKVSEISSSDKAKVMEMLSKKEAGEDK